MRNLKYIIKRQVLIIGLLICSSIFGLKAQNRVTNNLGIDATDLLNTLTAGSTSNFTIERQKLQLAVGDCFLITAQYSSANFSLTVSGSKSPVYQFNIAGTLVYEIGVVNSAGTLRWYIRRPTNLAGIGKSINLDYEIYDNLGVDGKFTFILGHHFTAIAVDGTSFFSNDFKLAPVFFGMDSNLGGQPNYIGQFTGESSTNLTKAIYCRNISNIYKMHLDAKMATLINALQTSSTDGNIINAIKPGDTNDAVLISDLTETSLVGNLRLYPNPSDGKFNVDFSLNEDGLVSFKIYDLKGQKVYEQNDVPFAKGKHTYSIDVSSKLPAGAYILKVSSAEINQSVKLIVN